MRVSSSLSDSGTIMSGVVGCFVFALRFVCLPLRD
jgi:hypothetical protein